MGKGKAKQLKAAAAAPPLKAQGTGKKRTPQSAFDSAAGKDVYEPEKVIAQRTAKGGSRSTRSSGSVGSPSTTPGSHWRT